MNVKTGPDPTATTVPNRIASQANLTGPAALFTVAITVAASPGAPTLGPDNATPNVSSSSICTDTDGTATVS